MTTAEIRETAEGQTVVLPKEFRLEGPLVGIRRQGNALLLEPVKPTQWPAGFFESIRIDDPAFERAEHVFRA